MDREWRRFQRSEIWFHELFREYMAAARQLLLSEPPSSRVIVSLITTDSFGGSRVLLKGRTPDVHGVFTDELDRARHQLAAAFEAKAAGATPIAAGTDILGALWRVSALLQPTTAGDSQPEREVWIFSDMVNETPALPMPALLAAGPEKMLEQAKSNRLLVTLKGDKVHVVGASTRGLSPQAWEKVKEFWSAYLNAAQAELVSYSAEVSPER